MPSRRAVLAGSAASVAALAGLGGATSRVARRPVPARVHGEADARIGFGGDAMLGRSVDERWAGSESDGSAREPAGVWGSTLPALRRLDGLFLNLECSVSTRGERTPDRGYYFRADPGWALPALSAAGTSFASLANNHLLDFGPTALADTVDHLDGAGIATAGAGRDRAAAFEPTVATADDLDVGVIALTDQSRSYRAGPDSAGTAWLPLDPERPETRERVETALEAVYRRDPDLVVASLHWGPNWEVRPSATQRRFARWLVERGVDVVHGHSAHVVQGIEVYRGRPILYDLGDYVDDYIVKEGLHNDRSVRVELVVEGGRLDRLHVAPVEISDERVEPATGEVAAWVRERMASLSADFGTNVEREGRGLSVPLVDE
ncbi:poly-gamma-glutamate synthesis protein [Halosimplex carlsbadense 2-9-1]|uniref:Poly-gamma-glutamate synthesis protein n=1 Tax=Halosimplex carlsbadense 2-9-1 TaxID=797114 RepID=M0CNN3_9EURY|nr:CapA family protein [Halosimplex carlsbadense]ELZ24880.1 poly-gamma-glutamate synthesis protein [Halosimplex carlsbadense 2-9-1]